MKSVIPWSFSSYNEYQTCPRKFYEEKIAKTYPFIETEAIRWGNRVHKAFEDYIRDNVPLGPDTIRFKRYVDKFKDAPGKNFAEVELACTVDLKPTGFWSDDAWVRGKGDLVKVNTDTRKALAADWKTGKWKPHSLQLDLMAVLVMTKIPFVEVTTTVFAYLQEPIKPVVATFTRADIPGIMEQFAEGVRDMQFSQEHNVWPEKPSGLCKQYCPVVACKYHGKGARGWRR